MGCGKCLVSIFYCYHLDAVSFSKSELYGILCTRKSAAFGERFSRNKDVFASWCAFVRCTVAHWAMECEEWSVVATGGGVELGKARGATMPEGQPCLEATLPGGAHARSRRSTKSDHSPPQLLLVNCPQSNLSVMIPP